jgi:hypothetical protein
MLRRVSVSHNVEFDFRVMKNVVNSGEMHCACVTPAANIASGQKKATGLSDGF